MSSVALMSGEMYSSTSNYKTPPLLMLQLLQRRENERLHTTGWVQKYANRGQYISGHGRGLSNMTSYCSENQNVICNLLHFQSNLPNTACPSQTKLETLQEFPTLRYAMHCTLTQFNWTTRTHCTNTTIYLLPLDTMQCTSMTLRFQPM